MGQILLGGALLISGCTVQVATLGSYTIVFGIQANVGFSLIATGLTMTAYHGRDISFHPKPSFVNSIYKSGSVDPNLPANPDELLKRPEWKETTHPDAGKKGHRAFENEKTGEIIRHDQGKPGQTGHKADDHYHHLVPDGKGGYNYVDGKENPVPSGSNRSHLYPSITK